MKKTLRISGLILLLAAIAFWAAEGATLGWSKTSVPRKTVDETTGIEGVVYDARFVPGLDFLVVAVLTATVLAGVSLVLPGKKLEAKDKP